jgi:membrane protein DedA with SNARE-associated domain
VDKVSDVFERHGGKAILIGHLIPGVGALISVPAGLKRMPIRWRFLGYTVLGGTLWTMAELYASIFGYAVLAVLILAVLWFLWRRWKAPR